MVKVMLIIAILSNTSISLYTEVPIKIKLLMPAFFCLKLGASKHNCFLNQDIK